MRGRPASWMRSAIRGLGARAAGWSSRRYLTIVRISASACDASASISRRASVAAVGCVAAVASPACARMAMADT